MEKIILDTDMLTDCDDAGAIALLLNLESAGECSVLGMAVSSRHPCSAAVVSAVNTYYGRGEIPIGAPGAGRGAYRPDSCFLDIVSSEFPHNVSCNASAENAVKLYRRILANAKENEIIIVTIGYMTNLADLLKSQPDEISSLNGKSLICKKVKRWICMGGNFPVDDAKDNVNFTRDMESAYYAITNWPGRIDFVGREIGHQIFAGEGLRATPKANPVRRAYELHRSRYTPDNWNHHTADPTTILYAVRGCMDNFTLSKPGNINLKPDGTFAWHDDINGTQRYLLQKAPRDKMAQWLDVWMAKIPSGEIRK